MAVRFFFLIFINKSPGPSGFRGKHPCRLAVGRQPFMLKIPGSNPGGGTIETKYKPLAGVVKPDFYMIRAKFKVDERAETVNVALNVKESGLSIILQRSFIALAAGGQLKIVLVDVKIMKLINT